MDQLNATYHSIKKKKSEIKIYKGATYNIRQDETNQEVTGLLLGRVLVSLLC